MKSKVWTLEYGELENDADFVGKCENLNQQLMDVQDILDTLLPLKDQIDTLPIPDQVEVDLLLVFMLNSLYFIKLRIEGVDFSSHPIRRELQRIKIAMAKWEQVKDRSKRPTVNVEVAKRFVRSGLFDLHSKENTKPPNKKIRFNDD